MGGTPTAGEAGERNEPKFQWYTKLRKGRNQRSKGYFFPNKLSRRADTISKSSSRGEQTRFLNQVVGQTRRTDVEQRDGSQQCANNCPRLTTTCVTTSSPTGLKCACNWYPQDCPGYCYNCRQNWWQTLYARSQDLNACPKRPE